MKKLNKKTLYFYYYKMIKQEGTPEYIARGVAIGLFIGLFIPFGLQIIAVLAVCIVVKSAKIPAITATFINNHFTVAFIYPAQCYVGSLLLGSPLSYAEVKAVMNDVVFQQNYNSLSTLGKAIVAAFFTGGAMLGIIIAVPGYFLSVYLVRKYRAQKELRREKKREQAAARNIVSATNGNPTAER